MIYKVTVWQMTEEQRLAYIEKHPIVPTEKRSGQTFAMKNLEKIRQSSKNGAKSTQETWEKRMAEKESNNED